MIVFGEELFIFVLQLELVLFSLFIYCIFNVLELFLCGQRCMLEFSLKRFELEIFRVKLMISILKLSLDSRVKLEISTLELSVDSGEMSTAFMITDR